MKQFIVFCVFAFSLAPVFEASDLLDLELGTSFKPGKCPQATRLSQAFDLQQYLGTWYEIKSTKPIFENGQRCVKANYKLDTDSGKVVVTNSGVNDKGETKTSVGSAATTDQDNVFAVKFFSLQPSAQYWVVDTDYKNYALVVSCNNILGLFNFSDVWILGRQPTLDAETIKSLEAKLESVGITGVKLSETVQNC